MLQHLGNGAQVAPLVSGQLTSRRHVDDVKGVRRYNGRVHVAVIQQVTNNLKQTGQFIEKHKASYQESRVRILSKTHEQAFLITAGCEG